MNLEKLLKKLPTDLLFEIKEFVIYKPKSNEELIKAVRLFTDDHEECFKLYGHIENWDTSLITNMSKLFDTNKTFNGDISRWDVSNVTNMHSMFCRATNFNQNISIWDIILVADMTHMFSGAVNFNLEYKPVIL